MPGIKNNFFFLEYVKDSALSISNSSLNSENPYATIKDLPMLMSRTSEGNYMEMKSPVHREMSYAEIGLFDEDAMYQVDSQEQGEHFSKLRLFWAPLSVYSRSRSVVK